METTLHRQLKDHYCDPGARTEVKLGRYRIDVVNGDRLVEIQRSGLAAIRDKVNKLVCDGYQVDVVKPLVARKRLIKLASENGSEISRRWSPLRATMLDVFDELLYFTRVFPHPNLRMLIPLIDIEELRYPGHGRRRRKRQGDFVVKDRLIIDVHQTQVFSTITDLRRLLPDDLPKKFDTRELAQGLSVPRHQAQRIGYVLRKIGAAKACGKRGNAIVYQWVSKTQTDKQLRKKKPKLMRLPPFSPPEPHPKNAPPDGAAQSAQTVRSSGTKRASLKKRKTTTARAR